MGHCQAEGNLTYIHPFHSLSVAKTSKDMLAPSVVTLYYLSALSGTIPCDTQRIARIVNRLLP